MSLFQKLVEIQKSVRALGKNENAGSGASAYRYVSGSKVLDVIRPKMDDLGVLLVQQVDSIENQRIDYKTKQGEKSELLSNVMMTFTWIDAESGEKLAVPFGANGMNNWDKGLGSALTYAERYFLLKFFHIATDEDDVDALPPRGNEDALPPRRKAQAEQKAVQSAQQPAKPELGDKALAQAQSRIAGGELALFDKLRETYALKGYQLKTLQDAVTDYKINNNIK